MKLLTHHKNYSVYASDDGRINYYSNGEIASLEMIPGSIDPKDDTSHNEIIIEYRSGEKYIWNSKYIDGYNTYQFGIAVSPDGSMLFAQTWDKGLFALDTKTGERIWRTKSKRGVTSLFVNDDTLTIQLHDYAMQLIDIKNGEVIKEKRPCTAWGFTALDNRHIVCQVTQRKWEIIEASTLETMESFTHKEFTGDHTDFSINHITLSENNNICVRGFKNVWDDSSSPPKLLPNTEFEHFVYSNYFKQLRDNNLGLAISDC